ncbi:hypothetical protein EBT31_09525 [bacterium]|nr:hypothetical protein [bacterium]
MRHESGADGHKWIQKFKLCNLLAWIVATIQKGKIHCRQAPFVNKCRDYLLGKTANRNKALAKSWLPEEQGFGHFVRCAQRVLYAVRT